MVSDGSGMGVHLILRYSGEDKSALRFGFIIGDDRRRNKGYGTRIFQLALQYAFEILKVNKVILGVFENNKSAYQCYKRIGFQEMGSDHEYIYELLGERWKCIEMEISNWK